LITHCLPVREDEDHREGVQDCAPDTVPRPSGLDPDISVANANLQAAHVAESDEPQLSNRADREDRGSGWVHEQGPSALPARRSAP
jgi:hypothetical protein